MTFKRAIVTAVGPLRILIDGDTEPIPFTPKSLIDPATLTVGDVVHANQSGHRLLVLGRAGGLGLLSGRNLIINSNFMVNQEGRVSEATIADNAYLFDQWKHISGFTTGFITWSDAGGVRTVTLGTPGNFRQLRQPLELSDLTAGTYTLSWAGTVQGRVYHVGATVPAYASSPITVEFNGTANVNIEFQGEGGTLRNAKLERGTVATPYEPPNDEDNLRTCMRYYQRFSALESVTRFGFGIARTSTLSRISVPMLVLMRDSGVTLTYSADLRVTQTGAVSTISSLSVNSRGTNIMYLECAHPTMTGGGVPIELLAGSTGSFIAFDARL